MFCTPWPIWNEASALATKLNLTSSLYICLKLLVGMDVLHALIGSSIAYVHNPIMGFTRK